jgi:hypothetical protein
MVPFSLSHQFHSLSQDRSTHQHPLLLSAHKLCQSFLFSSCHFTHVL